jgi:Zn-finger nucleic acid-binding protein
VTENIVDCPNCSEPLRSEVYRANPYLVCFYCRGAWVPKDALLALNVPIPILQIHRETSRQCPSCRQALWPGTIEEIQVEFCKNCRSIWFDGDELEQVAGRYRSEIDWARVGGDLQSTYEFLGRMATVLKTVGQIVR